MLLDSNESAWRASMSDIGFFLCLLVNASIACTIASMPVAAVTIGGRPSVSSASSTARSAYSCAATTPVLVVSPVVTMAMLVTSEPVPAVVGTCTSGSRLPVTFPIP